MLTCILDIFLYFGLTARVLLKILAVLFSVSEIRIFILFYLLLKNCSRSFLSQSHNDHQTVYYILFASVFCLKICACVFISCVCLVFLCSSVLLFCCTYGLATSGPLFYQGVCVTLLFCADSANCRSGVSVESQFWNHQLPSVPCSQTSTLPARPI